MAAVDEYLWQVYERAPVKKDNTGDFTWKDTAAAKRMHVSLKDYVIRGMDPDFREQLYHAGHAMDAAGLRWSMLSAFRDDYRQTLAAGFKARTGNSLHGGSRAVGGYGHGRAIDINNVEGDDDVVWHWIDAHGAHYGLRRPMPGMIRRTSSRAATGTRSRRPCAPAARTRPRRRSRPPRLPPSRATGADCNRPAPRVARKTIPRYSDGPSTMYCRELDSRRRTVTIFS